MEDYCSGCRYNKKLKTGPDACPFHALCWEFYERHTLKLGHNARIGMAYQRLKKMDPAVKESLIDKARELRADLNRL